MSSADCCGGSCGCGSDCKCQKGDGGCKVKPDISTPETATTVAPYKRCHEGSKTGCATSEHDGCKCETTCTCKPCNCK